MQEEVDGVHGVGVDQPFNVVEHQQAGCALRLNGFDQQLSAPSGAMGKLAAHVLAPPVLNVLRPQAGLFESQG